MCFLVSPGRSIFVQPEELLEHELTVPKEDEFGPDLTFIEILSPERLGSFKAAGTWVKELKRVSNVWLKERGRDFADFEWQGGYADFSVSQSNLELVKQYIAGQEEHHRKIGFQDELRALLKRHEIAWDEKYVWD